MCPLPPPPALMYFLPFPVSLVPGHRNQTNSRDGPRELSVRTSEAQKSGHKRSRRERHPCANSSVPRCWDAAPYCAAFRRHGAPRIFDAAHAWSGLLLTVRGLASGVLPSAPGGSKADYSFLRSGESAGRCVACRSSSLRLQLFTEKSVPLRRERGRQGRKK